jgi:hypothetical protein
MKHIKSVNEFYHRAAGFKYSKPSIKVSIVSYYIASSDDLTVSNVKSVLKYLDILSENISIDEEVETITIPGPIGPDGSSSPEQSEQIDIDGMLKFDIFVYNEKEIDKILDDISKEFYVDYDVRLIDISAKEQSKVK